LEKQQLKSVTAQAAEEKIMRKSYRELKAVLIFSFFCIKAKGHENKISTFVLSQNQTKN